MTSNRSSPTSPASGAVEIEWAEAVGRGWSNERAPADANESQPTTICQRPTGVLMPDIQQEKASVERAIERARDDISVRIDELDQRIRTQYDFKQFAAEHATQIVAGGAVLGLLIGFG